MLRCTTPVSRHSKRPTDAGRTSRSPSPGRLGSFLGNVPTPPRPPRSGPRSPRAPSLPISQQRTSSIPARSSPCQASPERAACVGPCRRFLSSGKEVYSPSRSLSRRASRLVPARSHAGNPSPAESNFTRSPIPCQARQQRDAARATEPVPRPSKDSATSGNRIRETGEGMGGDGGDGRWTEGMG